MEKTTEVVETPPEVKSPEISGIEKTASIKNLATALAKFQGAVESVGKDASNPFFKSKYATLAAIVDTIRKPLSENGLSYSQLPIGDGELITILMHSSGEFISSTVKMTPKDKTPQAQGSAITYMRRYALSAILGIVTDEDDDGNAASKPDSKPEKPKTVKKEEIDGLGELPPSEPTYAPTPEVKTYEAKAACAECEKEITEKVRAFSMKRYGRALCMDCQKNNDPVNG